MGHVTCNALHRVIYNMRNILLSLRQQDSKRMCLFSFSILPITSFLRYSIIFQSRQCRQSSPLSFLAAQRARLIMQPIMQLSEAKCLYQVVRLIRDTLFRSSAYETALNLSPTWSFLLERSSTFINLQTAYRNFRYILARLVHKMTALFSSAIYLCPRTFPFIPRAKERCPFVKTNEIFDSLWRRFGEEIWWILSGTIIDLSLARVDDVI